MRKTPAAVNRSGRGRKSVIGGLIALALLLILESVGQITFYLSTGVPYYSVKNKIRQSTQFSPYTLYKYPPNSSVYMSGYPDVLKTDRYGFIHNGQDSEIKTEDYTVFILGGSTVEGRGASSNSQTICAQLEIMLSKKIDTDRPIRVINAGRVGFNAYQEFLLLSSRLVQDFSPDLVVSLDGRNDAYYLVDRMGEGWKPNWQPYYDELEHKVNSVMQRPLVGAFRLLASALADYLTLDDGIRRLVAPPVTYDSTEVPAEIVGRGVRSYLTALELCKTNAGMYGFDFLAVLQPVLLPRMKISASQAEREMVKRFLNSYSRAGYYVPYIDSFYKRAVADAREYQWFHDMSGLFENNGETLYYDSCHYNDGGNRLIARRLAEIIAPVIAARLERQ